MVLPNTRSGCMCDRVYTLLDFWIRKKNMIQIITDVVTLLVLIAAATIGGTFVIGYLLGLMLF